MQRNSSISMEKVQSPSRLGTNRYSSSQLVNNNESSSMLIRQAPASTAFKNAFLSRATEYEHVEQVVPLVQDDKEKKEELLMQMGI